MAAAEQYEYVGSISAMVLPWAPPGFAACDGSIVPVGQVPALSYLLGAAWGGDGTTTFGIPNLNGRVPVGMGLSTTGTQYDMARQGGAEAVRLHPSQMPPHTHPVALGDTGAGPIAQAAEGVATPSGEMASTGAAGGAEPVTLIQPFGAVAFQICFDGTWPDHA